MLTVGEKLWNGATVTPQLAAAYNAMQARIAAYTAQGKGAPDELLNGAHNLIASALAPNPCNAALRALSVESMTAQEIYDNRATIGAAVIRAREEARDLQAESDCRAIGYRLREYAESISDRLATVIRP